MCILVGHEAEGDLRAGEVRDDGRDDGAGRRKTVNGKGWLAPFGFKGIRVLLGLGFPRGSLRQRPAYGRIPLFFLGAYWENIGVEGGNGDAIVGAC